MHKDRVVIIGGDAAGMSAAAKIRREQPDRDILVLERTSYTSYSACGIPYYIGGLVENSDDLVARSPETFRDEYDIDVRIQHEVTSVDVANQRVLIRTDEGQEFSEPYDQLLIATGARPSCPKVPNADAEGIFGLSTLASGLRVQEFLNEINHAGRLWLAVVISVWRWLRPWFAEDSMCPWYSVDRRSWEPLTRTWDNLFLKPCGVLV
jgi:NADH dehydrogenase FAD-containing subunit